MKSKWRNIFFAFGMVALAIMLTQLDYSTVKRGLMAVGYRFPAVVALWGLLYVLNTTAWFLIINADGRTRVRFWWLYKITISGFALNYATPGGLMGGEPYRIMELRPYVGAERASSSVILYVMAHIFSHFWFWLFSVILFVFTRTVSLSICVVLIAITAFCLLGLWFFIIGYRNGFTAKIINAVARLPFVGKYVRTVAVRNEARIADVDHRIAALHRQSRWVLVSSVALELTCRVCSAAEVYLIISLVAPDVDFVGCILILGFTSLFANLLFFMPLQIGGREGGFLMSAVQLGLGGGAGIFTALIVRIRELVWTAIGLLLIQTGKKASVGSSHD